MARETRRMALYEAIRNGQSKRRGRKKTVHFRPFASARRASATRKKEVGYYQRLEDGDSAKSKLAALWTPRVNLALSYPVIVCLLVAGAALLVVAFRFGQLKYDTGWLFFEPVAVSEPASDGLLDNPDLPELIDPTVLDSGKNDLTTGKDNETVENNKIEDTSAGANVIVIQEYRFRKDLEPVKKHYEDNGIETEILERGEYFFLVTKARFHGFGSGADGEPALRKIVEIGATYKAPPEYGRFPTLFEDAYGRKLDTFLGE